MFQSLPDSPAPTVCSGCTRAATRKKKMANFSRHSRRTQAAVTGQLRRLENASQPVVRDYLDYPCADPSRSTFFLPMLPISTVSSIYGHDSSGTRRPTAAPTTLASCQRRHPINSRARKHFRRSLPLAGRRLHSSQVMNCGKPNSV